MLGETTSRRGILDPEAARRHYRLTRYAPAADLAHLVERHWIVEWDLRAPFTQQLVTHPVVNLVFESHVALVHGVVTGRGAKTIAGRGKAVGVKFRPGGFGAFTGGDVGAWTDRVLPLSAAFGDRSGALVGDVLAATRDDERAEVMDAFLLERVAARDER